MAPRIERDGDHPTASGTRQMVLTTIGTGLIVFGSAIVAFLLSQGWNWGVGLVAGLLIVEGIDCLFAGITGRNGAMPILLAWWPMS